MLAIAVHSMGIEGCLLMTSAVHVLDVPWEQEKNTR